MTKAWFAGMCIALGAIGFQSAPTKAVGAAIFPIGLILIYYLGGDLFTGKNLLLMNVYKGELSPKVMVKRLAFVWLGNLVGAVTIGGLVNLTDFIPTAEQALLKADQSPLDLIIKGVLCNICVCLAVYFAGRSKNHLLRLTALFLPVCLFVLCGFEHCVADMYYLSATGMGVVSPEFWYVQLFSLIGNLIGGLGIASVLYVLEGDKAK